LEAFFQYVHDTKPSSYYNWGAVVLGVSGKGMRTNRKQT